MDHCLEVLVIPESNCSQRELVSLTYPVTTSGIYISPIPFAIRYFSEYIMYKPENLYSVFIKECCTAYIIISFYRQLITYFLGVVFWNDIAIFIILTHSLMAMFMY